MASDVYEKMKQPPKWALREIKSGDLKGKTDINPQWRYQIMTEVFGLVGVGWKYEIQKLWTEQGGNSEVLCFAQVAVYIRDEGEWSDPIVGIGGSKLVHNFSNAGIKSNDEGYKMAVTDAFSTALKMLGVAADIYAGKWDGSKFADLDKPPKQQEPEASDKTKAEAELTVKKFEDLADKGYISQDSLANMKNAYGKLKSEKDYRSFINNCNKNIAEAEKKKAAEPEKFDDDQIPF